MAVSKEEKSEEFARHMASVHQTPINPAFDTKFKDEIDTYFETFLPPAPSSNAIGPIHVRKEIQRASSTNQE